MFHWICPECGREIAPTVRECPACDGGSESAELVLAGVVEASARTLNVEASGRTSIAETAARAPNLEPFARKLDVEPLRGRVGIDPGSVDEPEDSSAARESNPRTALPAPVKWGRKNGQPGSDREVGRDTGRDAARDSAAGLPRDFAVKPGEPPSVEEISKNGSAALVSAADLGLGHDPDVPETAIAVRDLIDGLNAELATSDAAPAKQGSVAEASEPPTAASENHVESGAHVAPMPEAPARIEAAPDAIISAIVPALVPEILDAKSALDRAADSRAEAILGSIARSSSGPKAEQDANSAPAVRAITTRTVETRAVETKPAFVKAIESKPLEARSVEAKPVEAKPVEAKPVEAKPLESKSLEKAVESTPLETKPVESASPAAPPANVSSTSEPAPQRESAPTLSPDQASPDAAAANRVPLIAKLTRLALPKIASNRKGHQPASERAEPAVEIAPSNAAAAVPSSVAESATPSDHPLEPTESALAGAAGIEPERSPQDPLLPSFAPGGESLDNLIAAVGFLDDRASEPDPPASGKLPVPLRAANMQAVAPSLVSLGSLSPKAPKPPGRTLAPENAAALVVPKQTKIAGLTGIEQRFAAICPVAKALERVRPPGPVNMPPRAGSVRPPRSPIPFLGPAMARLVKYSPLAKHPLRPAAPEPDMRKAEVSPRITLPGPMLTKGLVSFQDRGLAPVFLEERAFRKRFSYGWIALVLAIGTIIGVGFSNMISTPPPNGEAKPAAAVEAASPGETTAPPARPSGSSPLSKALEVTGFRIVMDPSRKAEVQYLVVNHSPTRFSDATVYVTLHAADAHAGQPPLCRFSFAAPILGPFEAKEMISAIEKINRPANLPDWQDLRAEIEIGQ